MKNPNSGLVKHPSGFYVDAERYRGLPDADEFHKVSPANEEAALFYVHGAWWQGWGGHSASSGLQFFTASAKYIPYVSIARWAFSDVRPMMSEAIHLSMCKSPARLALERYKQRLDGILM